MDDLMQAIEEHSHYDDGADSSKFWETMHDKYWDKYAAQVIRPSYKDFMIWCEEQDLIMDDEAYDE